MRAALIVALLMAAIGVVWLVRIRMKADRRSHVRDGLAQFAAAFSGRDLPFALLEHTYAHLIERREAVGENDEAHFLVAPGHDLRAVYHLDALDIEDAVLVIADRARARLPKAHDLDELKGHVYTVSDLVGFLEPYFEPQLSVE